MLDLKTLDQLRSLARDDESFNALKLLFENERRKTEIYREFLNLLESAVRNDYDSILITDLDLNPPGPNIVYVNDGFEKMTGYTRDEVIGKSPRILQGEKTDPKVLAKLRKSLETGNSFFGQAINYRKDGSEFVNQWDIHPLVDKDGKITHWVSYQHDITERKRAEQKLVNSNLDFDEIYQDSKKTLIDLAIDGTVVNANKAFREILGYQKEEVNGKKLWDFVPEHFTAEARALFKTNGAGHTLLDKPVKLIFRRKNGMSVESEINFSKMSGDGQTYYRGEVENLSLRNNVIKILQMRNQSFSKVFERNHDFCFGYRIDDSGSPHVLWYSDNFGPLTGYSPEECMGPDGLAKIIHPDDIKKATDHFEAVKCGRSACHDFRIVKKSGEELAVMGYSKANPESPGEFKSAIVTVSDGQSMNTV